MLPIPHLSYSDEFDPAITQDVVDLVYPECSSHDQPERRYRIPVVTLEFPKAQRVEAHKMEGIWGLTQEQVNWINEQKIAMPWAAIPSVEFLFAEAQNLWRHPLLMRFDTAIRDSMGKVSVEAVYRAFHLLSDYLYDTITMNWADSDTKYMWHRMITYYYWMISGEVGSGLPYFYAKMDQRTEWTPAKLRELYEGIRARERSQHLREKKAK